MLTRHLVRGSEQSGAVRLGRPASVWSWSVTLKPVPADLRMLTCPRWPGLQKPSSISPGNLGQCWRHRYHTPQPKCLQPVHKGRGLPMLTGPKTLPSSAWLGRDPTVLTIICYLSGCTLAGSCCGMWAPSSVSAFHPVKHCPADPGQVTGSVVQVSF